MKTKGNQTKQRILETASTLFWKHSYHSLNMSAISQAAGVNKATVYGYFSSKEELAIATIQANHQAAKTCVFEPSLQASDNPIEQLQALYHSIFELSQRTFEKDGIYPGCPFINMAMELATANSKIREAVQNVFNDQAHFYHQLIERAIAQGLSSPTMDPSKTAQRLVATMSGGLVLAKIRNSPQEILAMMPVAQTILLG